MNKLSVLLLLVSLSIGAAEKPGLCGIELGMTREAAIKQAQTLPHCEIVTDSNSHSLNLNSSDDSLIRCGKNGVQSIKLMYNKKKGVQGISIVFSAQTADEVETAYRFAETLFGKPKTAVPSAIGFAVESEWSGNGVSASFFASSQTFEAYLLMGYSGFIKEEELKGNREQ